MKGLNKEFNVLNQPKDTYPFALNAAITTIDSKYANISNEPSNELSYSLPEGYTIYGSLFTNESNIIFSGNGIDSEIGEFKNDQYTTILSDVGEICKLNFTGIIKGKEFRVRAGCNKTIYWSDNINPDRKLDLDNLDSVYTNGQLDCEKFKFSQQISIPNISLQVNNQGGNLESGQYAFVIEQLDDSENVIHKSIPTKYIPVYYDSFNNEYGNIHGSLNIDQFLSDVGGKPNTNKSITLEIDNIDSSTSFIRINVLRLVNGSGEVVTAHTIGSLFSSSLTSFTYTGFNSSNGDTIIDSNSLIAKNVIYTKSRAMEQVDNRLVRANVTEQTRDYSNYQRAANNITTRPTLRTIEAKQFNNSAKNPENYLDLLTFQGDEIYAFCIFYQHDDGTESPPFHIPGRAKINGVDDIIIPADPSNPELSHLPEKSQYEQWEVYNTASYETSAVRFGYYETGTNYPDTLDCNGEPIYGELVGTPIRHHRFPCRKTIPLQFKNGGEWFINFLGIEFDNVVYPNDSIVSHRFGFAKRTDLNKTVLDSGYVTGTGRSSFNSTFLRVFGGSYGASFEGVIQDPAERFSTTHFQFISPNSLGRIFKRGSYLKFNNAYFKGTIGHGVPAVDREGGGLINIQYFINDNVSSLDVDIINRSITEDRFLSGNSTENNIFGFSIKNIYLNNSNLLIVSDEITNPISGGNFPTIDIANLYSYKKQYITPYSNLESIHYVKMSSNLTELTHVSYAGDTFIVELNPTGYSNYSTVGNDVQFSIEGSVNFYTESNINFDLIVEGENCNTVWNGNSEFADSIFFFGLNKIAVANGTTYTLRSETCNPFYNYNQDYNYKYSYPILPLSNNFDYCDSCLSFKPNRIIFSPKSFDEELADYYIINKVNDYIDIPQERGEIVGIKYKNNKLYVHTTDSTFVLQPNPQAISTDQNVAYLSTGDFLGIPPQEIMSTDLGYGGMQYELANINTEFGYFWVDQKRGQIFRLTNSLDTISNKGLSMWFKKNMFNDVQIGYDPYFQRLIFTHKNSDLCRNDWTLSFYPFYDAFISFYSYYPDLMFSDHNNYYTVKNNLIYKHLKSGSYTNFYEEQYPFIIEEVSNNFSTDNLHTIYYYTEFYKDENNELNELLDQNYNQLTVYNNLQSTGVLDLVRSNDPYFNINLNPNQKSVIVTDKNSKISNLYDYSTSNIVTQKECRQDNIYKEIDFINADPFKSQYDFALFRDKYIKARLIFNPPSDDIKVIHYLTQLNEKQSIR